MPYTLTWEAPSGACRTFTGRVTGDDLIRSLVELTTACEFDSLRYSMSIFRGVTAIDADRSTLEDMAAVDYGAYESNPRFVSAVVADDALVAHLLRSFEGLHVSRIPRRFFNTEADARAWIESGH
jgi:hypothetical protein